MFVEFRFHFPWTQRVCTFLQEKEARRRPYRRIKIPQLSLPGFVCVAAENGVSSEGSIDYVVYVIPIFGEAGILSAQSTATVQAIG